MKSENECEGLVREFYAYAFTMPKQDDEGSVEPVNPYSNFVKGKEIDFSPSAINEFFQLTDTCNFLRECYFSYLEGKPLDAQQVLYKLCKRAAKWAMTIEGLPKHILKTHLNQFQKQGVPLCMLIYFLQPSSSFFALFPSTIFIIIILWWS